MISSRMRGNLMTSSYFNNRSSISWTDLEQLANVLFTTSTLHSNLETHRLRSSFSDFSFSFSNFSCSFSVLSLT